jgi:SAM-dependent methyltransferase
MMDGYDNRACWSATRERIGGFFDRRIHEFGYDLRALDYGQRETQQIRFGVIGDMIPLAGKSVLDVGCGFGDFADYLGFESPDPNYVGVDISPLMIAQARRRRHWLNLRQLDILEDDPGGPFDLVIANGIFYLLGDEAEAIMERLIARMFALCREAVIFTSLSRWAPTREPGEFYADPLRTLDFCRALTPYVVLRHDYLPHDFALALYRNQR